MAEEEKELEITLKWKNNDYFEMTAKRDAGSPIQVVRMEENGQLKQLWPYIANICESFFKEELKKAGKDMAG